jgi:hypothetical protein
MLLHYTIGGLDKTAGMLLGLAAVPLAAPPAASVASATWPPALLADCCFQLRDVLTGQRVGCINIAITAVDAVLAPPAVVAAPAGAPVAAQSAATVGRSATGYRQCGTAGVDPHTAEPAARSPAGSIGGDGGHGGKQSSVSAARATAPAAGSSRQEAPLPDAAAPDAAGLPPSDGILVRVHRVHGLAAAAEGALVLLLQSSCPGGTCAC